MADNDVLRLRASLEDKVSPGLRAISQEAARFGRSFNFATPRREVEGLRGQFRALGNEVKNTLVPAFSSLGLVGGSMTLAVLGMARAVKGYSEGMQDLGISSKELGLSVRNLRAFEQAAGKVRIAPEEALQGLQSFKKNAEDFQLRIGSLRDELRTLGAGDVVEAIRRAQDPLDQMRIAFQRMEELQKRNPAVARRYAEAMFGSAKFARLGWEDFRKEFERVGGMTEEEVKKAEKLNAAWLNIGASLDILKQKAVGHLLPGVTSALNDVTKIIDALEKVDQWVESKIGKGDPITNLKDRLIQGKQDFGADPMGEDYSRGMRSGPTGSELKKGPPVGRDWRLPGFRENEKVKDGVKEGVIEGLQKFTSLQGGAAGGGGGIMNASFGGFGGGGGGRGTGPGAFGSAEFPFQGGGAGSVPQALSGSAAGEGGGGTTRGDRNNNPGNLKFGPLAKAFGATGADDKGFAIFPNKLSGSEAQSALVKSDRYKGLTLDQFGGKYAEGHADWKKTVGGALGIKGGDIVDNQHPGLLDAIRKAEGTGKGGTIGSYLKGAGHPGGMDPMAPAGSGLEKNTTVISSPSGAKFRVSSEFAPNFQRFIDGYEREGGVIGKNSGGLSGRPGNASYHPMGRAIDVNQIGYGIRGGGKLLPNEVEERLAEEAGLYPGSKFKRRHDAGHFEVRNREFALAKQKEWETKRIDAQVGGGGGKLVAQGTVNVNVAGPAGTKVDANSDGLFQTTKVQRVRQMEPAGMNSGDGSGQ